MGVLAVIAVVLVTGCSTPEKPRANSPTPSYSGSAVPTAQGDSAKGPCTNKTNIPTGVFKLSDSRYLHATVPASSEVGPCFSYLIYDGGIGDRSAPAGTGASAVQAVVIFVNGEPQLTPKSYLFKGIRFVSATRSGIVVDVDTRDRGIDPPKWQQVVYKLDPETGKVISDLPDQSGRSYIVDFGSQREVRAGDAAPKPSPNAESPTASSFTNRPASDFAAGPSYEFRSPSGAINCRAFDTGLICQMPDHPHKVSSDLQCGYYKDAENSVTSFGWSNFDQPLCATIIQGNLMKAKAVLGYGESVTFRPRSDLRIVCSSTEAGIRCENLEGYGFTLSKESFTRYRVG
ncbi:hypothetical protein [Gordonia alkaliphila]|uniref:hypothetical protein n=1 Tax=Gordonia alkaliphila TaxID=1053547 RepID=UPI0031E5C025